MMEHILWQDFTKNKKNLLLKLVLPFALTLVAYQIGFGNLSVIMILIFIVITGAGLKIVQLKSSGVYNRLITAPVSKPQVFIEMTILSVGIYTLQFLPTFLVSMYYNNIMILLFLLLSLFIVVPLGILVGIHATSFGQIHLQSLLTVLPLAALAMIPAWVSYLFPFVYVVQGTSSWQGGIGSLGIILGLLLVIFVDVSRL
jgi:hypothetical protein